MSDWDELQDLVRERVFLVLVWSDWERLLWGVEFGVLVSSAPDLFGCWVVVGGGMVLVLRQIAAIAVTEQIYEESWF